MKMCLVMILVMKVFIFSKTMIICLLCPLLCGLFFFWKGAKGELSYKVKKDRVLNDLKLCLFLSNSERAGIRTPDNLIKSQVLYHLSYTPLNWGSWTRTSGAGVRILCLTTWRYPINATARLYYHMFPTTVNTFFEFF